MLKLIALTGRRRGNHDHLTDAAGRICISLRAAAGVDRRRQRRGVEVDVGSGVSVGMGVSVGLSVGISVGIAVGISVGTSVGVSLGVGSGVCVGTGVGTGVNVSVATGSGAATPAELAGVGVQKTGFTSIITSAPVLPPAFWATKE